MKDKVWETERERQECGRVNGCCQSAIGFSICWISPQASKRQLNRDPIPSFIPCPDNKRPVWTPPLTGTGCWLVGTWLKWRELLKCHIETEKTLFYWPHRFRWMWFMRGISFWLLFRSSLGVSRIFKLWQKVWEEDKKPRIHVPSWKRIYSIGTFCKDA